MFAQFRAQYPQGSITTEMLDKTDGLHVFRAKVAHGDCVLATATAADRDLEVAEDRAVERALAMVGIVHHSYDLQATLIASTGMTPVAGHLQGQFQGQTQGQLQAHRPPNSAIPEETMRSAFVEDRPHHPPVTAPLENLGHPISDPVPLQAEFTPLAATHPPVESPSSAFVFDHEPIDLSEELTKIDVERERLGWTGKQEQEYLQKTFGKRSRQQLTTPEVRQFLAYLKTADPVKRSAASSFASTPANSGVNIGLTGNPNDLKKEIEVQMARLGWSVEDGRNYLERTFNKRSRQHLSTAELQQFCQYLQSLPSLPLPTAEPSDEF